MIECGRCGNTDPREVKYGLVPLYREAIQDGREHKGPDYDHGYRCRDRERCRERARRGAA